MRVLKFKLSSWWLITKEGALTGIFIYTYSCSHRTKGGGSSTCVWISEHSLFYLLTQKVWLVVAETGVPNYFWYRVLVLHRRAGVWDQSTIRLMRSPLLRSPPGWCGVVGQNFGEKKKHSRGHKVFVLASSHPTTFYGNDVSFALECKYRKLVY